MATSRKQKHTPKKSRIVFKLNRSQIWVMVGSLIIVIIIVGTDMQNRGLGFLGYKYSKHLESSTSASLKSPLSQQDRIDTTSSLSGKKQQDNQSAELADDFPPDVPIYPGTIVDSSRSMVAGRRAWTLTIKSTRDREQIVKELQELLAAKGWTNNSELIDNQSITFAATKGTLSIVVYAMSTGHQSEMKYTISEQDVGTQ